MNDFLHSLALQTCNSVGIKSFPSVSLQYVQFQK